MNNRLSNDLGLLCLASIRHIDAISHLRERPGRTSKDVQCPLLANAAIAVQPGHVAMGQGATLATIWLFTARATLYPNCGSGQAVPLKTCNVRYWRTPPLRCNMGTSRWAMCGRLRVVKDIERDADWSWRPCVRPLRAVHMTAGHYAFRGSGPGQFPALRCALALVGCPDHRFDRHCITCCQPFPTIASHAAARDPV